jgi:hypothetical protein
MSCPHCGSPFPLSHFGDCRVSENAQPCRHPSEFVRQRLDSTYWCQRCRRDLGYDYKPNTNLSQEKP